MGKWTSNLKFAFPLLVLIYSCLAFTQDTSFQEGELPADYYSSDYLKQALDELISIDGKIVAGGAKESKQDDEIVVLQNIYDLLGGTTTPSAPLPVIDAQLHADILAFASANHTDLLQVDTSVNAFATANHADLLQLHTDILQVNTDLNTFASINHTDIGDLNTDLNTFATDNHSDLTTILAKLQDIYVSSTSIDSTISNFAATNDTHLTNVEGLLGTINSSAGTIDSTLTAFKAANHTDLGTVDTSVNTFASTNHTDLGTINTSLGLVCTNANQVTELGYLASIDTKLTAPLSVIGPLTDGQLRATPVPVSGPLTDGQLRASPVPVSVSSSALPTGAATEATLSAFSSQNHSDLLAIDGDVTTANSSILSFKSANHSDLVTIDTDLNLFASANHSDLLSAVGELTTLNATQSGFKSANHTDLLQLDTDLLAFKSANHADLGTATSAVNTVNTSVNSLATANHTDFLSVISTLGSPFQAGGAISNTAFIANAGTNLNTSALNLEATQSAFKSANHTDLGTLDTDLLAFKTQNNTNLGTINTTLGTLATAATQTTMNTRIGDVTETAPASDTASSGLNGRLQRIAQRITSFIALLPPSLGQKTMANSFAVTLASDQSAVPVNATIVSGGTINVVPVGTLATYSASTQSLVTVATPTDILTITGSATKTVKVNRILISGTQTNSGQAHFYLIKRSTADSGGTSSTVTATSHDSTDAAATAVVTSYTANPTLGTTVGTVRAITLLIPSSNAASSTGSISALELAQAPQKSIVLNGTSQQLVVNLNSISMAGSALDIVVEWTEE